MQNSSITSSFPRLFGLGIFRSPSPAKAAPARAAHLDSFASFEIPDTFTETQVEWILALHRLASIDRPRAMQILGEYAPARCSLSQAVCIAELFSLSARDASATLVDAMEDGRLRERMRSQADLLACE
jgi:hypothetical protein